MIQRRIDLHSPARHGFASQAHLKWTSSATWVQVTFPAFDYSRIKLTLEGPIGTAELDEERAA